MRFIGIDPVTRTILETQTSSFGKPDDRADRIFVDVTDDPLVGDTGTYDVRTREFTPPDRGPDYGRAVDPREFMLLFTQAQRIAIRDSAVLDSEVDDLMRLVNAPAPIRLRHPVTLGGLQLLVDKGLISAADMDRIRDGRPPVQR